MKQSDQAESGSSRRKYLGLVGTVGTGSLAGCIFGGGGDGGGGGGGGGSGKIPIGAPAAQTGTYDYLQESCTKVLELTTSQINEAGGPLGREINLLLRDTAVNPQTARNVVDQLVTVDGCEAICGMFSNEIPPNWDFLQSQQVPIVSYWPGSRFLDTRGGDAGSPQDLSDDEWVWRTIISDSVHTAGQAINAQKRGYNRVALLNTAAEGERSWMTGFKDAANALDDITIVTQLEVPEGASSYQSHLNRLHNKDFDAMVMSFGLEDAITALREFNQAGYDSAVLMSDGLKHADLVNQLGGNLPEENYAALGGASGPALEQLQNAFDEEYDTTNMSDDNIPWAIAAYDALNIVCLATHKAGEYNAKAIQKNIRGVSTPGGKDVLSFAEGKEALDNNEEINYQGAMSNANFSEKGNVSAATDIFTATADGWEELEPIPAKRIQQLLTSDDYTVSG